MEKKKAAFLHKRTSQRRQVALVHSVGKAQSEITRVVDAVAFGHTPRASVAAAHFTTLDYRLRASRCQYTTMPRQQHGCQQTENHRLAGRCHAGRRGKPHEVKSSPILKTLNCKWEVNQGLSLTDVARRRFTPLCSA